MGTAAGCSLNIFLSFALKKFSFVIGCKEGWVGLVKTTFTLWPKKGQEDLTAELWEAYP